MAADAPVIIAGAGPVGLSLAAELSWRGVPCVVVERGDGSAPSPRTNVIAARSMEHFRRIGLAEELRDVGLPDDYPPDLVLRTRFCGPDLAREGWWSRATLRASGHDEGVWPTPELPCRVNQTFFQPVLLRHVQAAPNVSVMLGCEVDRVEADDDAVRVSVKQGDRRSVLECSYLVGCDGAHSVVRKAIGATLEGIPELRKTVSVHFRSAALARLNTRPAWSYAIYNADLGFGGMFALDGRDHWLCHTGFAVGESTDGVDPHQLIQQMVGAEIDVEIIQVIRWTARALVANRFREGRVLLAGDAAHLWVPAAGFGMNSGIQEAMTLGWMLSATYRGWGAQALLDAYEKERRPLGEQVAAIVTEISRRSSGVKMRETLHDVLPDVERSGPAGEQAREVLRDYVLKHSFPQHSPLGLNFGYRYEGSPIVIPDGTEPPPFEFGTFSPDARPGHRLPHFRRADGAPVFDSLGPDFSLLCVGDGADQAGGLVDAAERAGLPLKVVRLGETEAEAGDLYRASLVLVRPDQHVAWRGHAAPEHPDAIIDRARGVRA
ncbi:MAG TPA: FAD-dependent monooxygenase [Solirubrobacteraceae bacterium]|nr:FAD-dependent monooxygenase [Solirubrobacteraceae bacterium]